MGIDAILKTTGRTGDGDRETTWYYQLAQIMVPVFPTYCFPWSKTMNMK